MKWRGALSEPLTANWSAMDFFTFPIFLKVGVSFTAILVLDRLKVPLGLAMAVSATGLAVWAGAGVEGLQYMATSFVQPANYLLAVVIGLMLYFIDGLNRTGRMERSIGALKSRFTSIRMLLGGLPALIGLLPMPGGALFSAPIVASLDKENSLKPAHKVAINYWFRHSWEYWWPLYPGVILAIRYSGLPLHQFILIQAPYTGISLLFGTLFLLRKRDFKVANLDDQPVQWRDMLASFIPVLFVIVGAVVGGPVLAALGVERQVSGLLAISLGLVGAVLIVFAGDPANARKSFAVFTKMKTLNMLLVIMGAQIYASSLQAPLGQAQDSVVTAMRDELMVIGIPLVPIIVILPLVSGLIMGIALGFVGASFPLVIGLLGQDPEFGRLAATTTLAFAAGYVGMILSPVHICFVVTKEYFKTGLSRAYPYLIRPSAAVLLFSFLLAGLYYFLF